MYQTSYAEVLADSAGSARAHEWRALDRAVALLKSAVDSQPRSPAWWDALTYTNQLWGFLIKSLASPDNDLPDQLRADLMSVGLSVMKEAGRIERNESSNFAWLAEICGIVRDGLT